MAANSTLNLVSLDFDTAKSSFKTFLKNQSVFRDYDFEGSNINVLLDVLAYNTYLNSFYLNMVGNEGFLDSAQMMSSVVSHAKELNYTPRSYRSAEALIDVSITTTGITGSFEIPKGTQFSGQNANGSFVFTTDRVHTLVSATSEFAFQGLPIYEGTYVNESFIVDNSITNQRFTLSNKNVDTSSIVVSVSLDNGATTTDYQQAFTLFGVTDTSTVYFVQATGDGYYEIVFGDNVFGVKPINNAIILVTYRISKGDASNGITTFFLDTGLGTYNGGTAAVTITPNVQSQNGSQPETIDSIKFRAPRFFQTQDRAITTSDFQNIVYQNFPIVKAVNVYGGETVSGSVEYGKVFISPISQSGTPLSNIVKNEILAHLSTRVAPGITPVIVDPSILYIIPAVRVTVDFNETVMSPADVKSVILNKMVDFNNLYLENFNTAFRFSQFAKYLNDADPSFLSIQASTLLKKISAPNLNLPSSIIVNFNNEIVPGTITTSQFLKSDGNTYLLTDYNPNVNSFQRTGSVSQYNIVNTNKVIYLEQILTGSQNYTTAGTVDYTSGLLTMATLTVSSFIDSGGIIFTASPINDDLFAIKNDVIELDIPSAVVEVVAA